MLVDSCGCGHHPVYTFLAFVCQNDHHGTSHCQGKMTYFCQHSSIVGDVRASPWDINLVRCNNVNKTKNILQCKYKITNCCVLFLSASVPVLFFLARLSTDIYCNHCH